MEKPDCIVFTIRDLSVGGINSVTFSLASEAISQGLSVYILVLSRKKAQVTPPANANVIYLTELVDGWLGLISRSINKAIPYLGNLILLRHKKRIFMDALSKIPSHTNKAVFICGYGAYSAIGSLNEDNVHYVSHSLKSALMRSRTGILSKLNTLTIRHLIGKNIICVSACIEKDWRKILEKKSADYKIKTIHNPINTNELIKRSEEPEEVEIDGDFFVFCGRLSAEKNIYSIIDAWKESNVTAKLVIIGDGPEKQKIKNYISANNIEGRAILVGRKQNPYPLMKKSKAVLLNSHYEGLPTVAIEAIVLGTPLIIGECGGTAYEVIPKEHHKNIFKKHETLKFAALIKEAQLGILDAYNIDTESISPTTALKKYINQK